MPRGWGADETPRQRQARLDAQDLARRERARRKQQRKVEREARQQRRAQKRGRR